MLLHDKIISGFLYALKPITIKILNVHEVHMHNYVVAFIILVTVLSHFQMLYMISVIEWTSSITDDLKMINNTSLRDVFAKGHNYREPKSIYWKHNIKNAMDSVEDYARQ
jgi:hypothetical protein